MKFPHPDNYRWRPYPRKYFHRYHTSRFAMGTEVNIKTGKPQEMTDKLILLRYRSSTIKNYISAFEGFINYHSLKDVKTLGSAEIKEYLMYLINERKVSASFQNIVINAIKFYIEKVCGGTASIMP